MAIQSIDIRRQIARKGAGLETCSIKSCDSGLQVSFPFLIHHRDIRDHEEERGSDLRLAPQVRAEREDESV
jgi:hypothetical protein